MAYLGNDEREEQQRRRAAQQKRIEAQRKAKAMEAKAKREDKPAPKAQPKPPPYAAQVEQERAAQAQARAKLAPPQRTFLPIVQKPAPVAKWRDETPPPVRPPLARREAELDAPAPPKPKVTGKWREYEPSPTRPLVTPPPKVQTVLQEYEAKRKQFEGQARLPSADAQGMIRWNNPEAKQAADSLGTLIDDYGVRDPLEWRQARVKAAVELDAGANDQKRTDAANAVFDNPLTAAPPISATGTVGGQTAPIAAALPLTRPETPEEKAKRERNKAFVEGAVGFVQGLSRGYGDAPAGQYMKARAADRAADDTDWMDAVGTAAGNAADAAFLYPQKAIETANSTNWDGSEGQLTVGQKFGIWGAALNKTLNPFLPATRQNADAYTTNELTLQAAGHTPAEIAAMTPEQRQAALQTYSDQTGGWGSSNALFSWMQTEADRLAASNATIAASANPNADLALINGISGASAQEQTYRDLQAKANVNDLLIQEQWLAVNGHPEAAQHVFRKRMELEAATNTELIDRNANMMAELVSGSTLDPTNLVDIGIGGAVAFKRANDILNAVNNPSTVTQIAEAAITGMNAVENGVVDTTRGFSTINNVPLVGLTNEAKAYLDKDEVIRSAAQLIAGITDSGDANRLVNMWLINPQQLVDGVPASMFGDPALLKLQGSDGMIRFGENVVANKDVLARSWLTQGILPDVGNFRAFQEARNFNPLDFLSELDGSLFKRVAENYKLGEESTAWGAATWLSDNMRGIMVDLNLNFNFAHHVRNAQDMNLKLMLDDIYSWRNEEEIDEFLGSFFGGSAPGHRLFETNSAIGNEQVQAVFGHAPLNDLAIQMTQNPYNAYTKVREAAQKNWMGNTRIGNMPWGEQAGYKTGLDAAFRKNLSPALKRVAKSYEQELVRLDVPPEFAKSMMATIHSEMMNGGGIAGAQTAWKRIVNGEYMPVNWEAVGIKQDALAPSSYPKLNEIVEWWRKQPDMAGSQDEFTKKVNDLLVAESGRWGKQLQGNPLPIGEHDWTTTNVQLDGAAMLDDAGETAAALGVAVPAQAQAEVAEIVTRQQEVVAAAVGEFKGNPNVSLELWRDTQDLRDEARDLLDELNREVRYGQYGSAEEKAAAWQNYWDEAKRVWSNVAAKQDELIAEARQSIVSGKGYNKKRTFYEDIDKFINWDREQLRTVQGASEQWDMLGTANDPNFDRVIKGHRIMQDRSRAILYETASRFETPDALDIVVGAQKQNDVRATAVRSFLEPYLADAKELNTAEGWKKYFDLRNKAWREYFEDSVIINANAAKMVVLRGSADEIAEGVSWTADGQKWSVVGQNADGWVVKAADGTQKVVAENEVPASAMAGFRQVQGDLEARVNEVVADVRASIPGPDNAIEKRLQDEFAAQIEATPFNASALDDADAIQNETILAAQQGRLPKADRSALAQKPDVAAVKWVEDNIPPMLREVYLEGSPTIDEVKALWEANQRQGLQRRIASILKVADPTPENLAAALRETYLTEDMTPDALLDALLNTARFQREDAYKLYDMLLPELAAKYGDSVATNGYIAQEAQGIGQYLDGRTVDMATGEILEPVADTITAERVVPSFEGMAPQDAVRAAGKQATRNFVSTRLGTPAGENAAEWSFRQMVANQNVSPNAHGPTGANLAAHQLDQIQGVASTITKNLEYIKNAQPNTLTPAQRIAAQKLLDQNLTKDLGNVVDATSRAAKKIVDMTMLDSTQRRGFDEWISLIFPFAYFHTRSAGNWVKRMARKPSVANKWYEWERAKDNENTQSGLPARLQGSIPFLTLANGTQVRMQDPLQSFLPNAYLGDSRFTNEDEARSVFGKWYNGFRAFAPGMFPHVSMAADAIQDKLDPLPNGETRTGRNYLGGFIPQLAVAGQVTGALGLGNLSGSTDTYQPYRVDRSISMLGVENGIPSVTVSYARQIVNNLKNGQPAEANIPPEQFQAANALYQQGVQQASGDRLATIGTRMVTGVGGYIWRPQEQDLNARLQNAMGAGYNIETNPYGSKEAKDTILQGDGQLQNWLNKGANAPAPDPTMRSPAESQQLSDYFAGVNDIDRRKDSEIETFLANNPDAPEDAVWEIRNKYAAESEAWKAQYPGIEIPEGSTAGMNPVERAKYEVKQFLNYEAPNKPGDFPEEGSPAEKAKWYKERAAWELANREHIRKNLEFVLKNPDTAADLPPEVQGMVRAELDKLLRGEYVDDVSRQFAEWESSILEGQWQNQIDFEKEMSKAEIQARAQNVEKLTGYTADEYLLYSAASKEQRAAMTESDPRFFEIAEAAYHPAEYAEGTKLFGADWYAGIHAKPKYPGEGMTPEQEAQYFADLAEWRTQYPDGDAARFWYYGRYQPDGEGRDYGSDYAVALDEFGDVFTWQSERQAAYANGKDAGWAWDNAHAAEYGAILRFKEWEQGSIPAPRVAPVDAPLDVNDYSGPRPVGTSEPPIGADGMMQYGAPSPSVMPQGTNAPPVTQNAATGLNQGVGASQDVPRQPPPMNEYGAALSQGEWVTSGNRRVLIDKQTAADTVAPPKEPGVQSDKAKWFTESRDLVYTEFGNEVGHLWESYYSIPKEGEGRSKFLEENPELKLTFAYTESPEKYSEAQELFGDDALLAWAFRPSGEDAIKEYYIQNPTAWAVQVWMRGRSADYDPDAEPSYDFGADWQHAIDTWGADIWQTAMQYRASDKAGRNAMWSDTLGAFWEWFYGPLEDGATRSAEWAGDGSAPLYHEGDFAYNGVTYNRWGQRLDSIGNVAIGGYGGGGGGSGGGGGGYSSGGGGGPNVYAEDSTVRGVTPRGARVDEVDPSKVRPTGTRTPNELGSWRPRTGLGSWRAGTVEKVATAKAWRS